ncbi:hypothetical protein DM860_007232 [Cuscuta australis]|uniref:Anaphase-promoting complex subunit 4 WD40 domain-containing protein n=1 Tax=Cuscuta australis TaxID=267555 RepID=A0A328E344_9ASTE|nr:hypothetical protein DM860_007232 [Cuscuta australis]
MDQRRTLTMNWDNDHEEDDDDNFFEPRDRFSSVEPEDLASSESDDNDFDDERFSFCSAISSANNSFEEAAAANAARPCSVLAVDYDLWLAEPGDVKERRRLLLQGMGLLSNKSMQKIASAKKLGREIPKEAEPEKAEDSKQPKESSCSPRRLGIVLVRSRSAGDIGSLSIDANKRKEDLIGSGPLIRNRSTARNGMPPPILLGGGNLNPFFLIKGGNEFDNNLDRFSPVAEEVIHRASASPGNNYDRKLHVNSYLTKSVRYSKRRGVAILRNIKGVVMNGEQKPKSKPSKHSSQWIKVRQHGKPYKEFTGLHLCQEIHGHQGSIWSIKFSSDAHYLASAGEDRVIHVWEVQECDVMAGATPVHPAAVASPAACASPVHPMASCSNLECGSEGANGERKKKKKGKSIPDYVIVPETVFALSEKPVCTLIGHHDVVLDLSWSRSQLLLSSSMDKTVRLWDVENQSCLKMFAHNDYVTSIQFNPVDDDYFISGSLDSKVRIWNISERKVVDWTDQKEMVTATCYTPNGKVHTEEAAVFTVPLYSQWNSSEVLISTADSSIRIHDGSSFTHKFKGFRNTSSQISASYSPDGRYVISPSEDSQVYIWRREESNNKSGAGGKGKRLTIHAHEHFPCKDVSVAIPWPGTMNYEPPVVQLHSKRHSKRFLPPPSPLQYGSPSNWAFIGSPSNEDEGLVSKRHLPPLPKRNDNNASHHESNNHIDAEFSGMDDHYSIGSPSPFWSSRLDGGAHHGGNTTIQAMAWGLVIVTASLGGQIRVYQNFGLPVKATRQTNLFRDLT